MPHNQISMRTWKAGSKDSTLTSSKRQRSKGVVHVTIRTKQSKSVRHVQRNQNKVIDIQSHEVTLNSHSKLADCHETIIDHHRTRKRKKTKCSRRLALIITVSIFVFSLITAVTLISLLIKPNTKKFPPAILRWNISGITIAGNGTYGVGSNQLGLPWDLFVDWSYTLYVTDRYNSRVQKYLRGNTKGTTVAGQANGIPGPNLTQLNQSTGIYVDELENVYVSDMMNARVVFWPKNASSGSVCFGQTDIIGNYTSSTLLNYPHSLGRDLTTGSMYVSDYANGRLVEFQCNLSSNTMIIGKNGGGTNNNQLSAPIASYFDLFTNSYLIANAGTNRIVRWVLGASTWTLVAGNKNGAPGNSSTELWSPSDVALDPMDNMYVADRYSHRIQFFLPNQTEGQTILGVTGIPGSNSTLLNNPISLAFDGQLNLYVTDLANNRVQKFLRY